MKYIMHFSEIGMADTRVVGGKNASLGELYNQLSPLGIKVPGGFATTADAFRLFIQENQLAYPLKQVLTKLNNATYDNLAEVGKACRGLLLFLFFGHTLMRFKNGAASCYRCRERERQRWIMQ